MIASAPLQDAAYAFAAGVLFVYVALRIARRPVAGPMRLAHRGFVAWWLGVALFLAIGAWASLLDAQARGGSGIRLALAVAGMLSVNAAVCGLAFYVQYLYTGRRALLAPLIAFYAAVCGVMIGAVVSDPSGAEVLGWHRSVVRLAILTGPLLSGAIVAFLLPAIAALAAYAGLLAGVHDPQARWRIALTTGSLLAWFGLAILALLLRVADTQTWIVVGRVLALAAAAGVLLAYAPPRPIASWLRSRAARRPG